MKRVKPFKAGYYIVQERCCSHYSVAEYSAEIDCFFLPGDPVPRTAEDIGKVIDRFDPHRASVQPYLFWFSLFCLVLSFILMLVHTPC